jgi:hypothetical protein
MKFITFLRSLISNNKYWELSKELFPYNMSEDWEKLTLVFEENKLFLQYIASNLSDEKFIDTINSIISSRLRINRNNRPGSRYDTLEKYCKIKGNRFIVVTV